MVFETFVWGNFTFKQALREDCSAIHELMAELCDYENMLDEFVSTPADLEEILFEHGCGDAILIFDNESDCYAGVIMLSYNYSTFKGKPGIFIEDFYVREKYRGCGLGSCMMKELLRIAKENGFGRVDWLCLKNNTSAIGFYEKIGANQLKDWTVFRIDDKLFGKL